jgi:transposase
VAARLRLADGPRDVPAATRFALRSVARRYEVLSAEIAELEAHLDRLVGQVAPELVSLAGHRHRHRRHPLDRGWREPPEAGE